MMISLSYVPDTPTACPRPPSIKDISRQYILHDIQESMALPGLEMALTLRIPRQAIAQTPVIDAVLALVKERGRRARLLVPIGRT